MSRQVREEVIDELVAVYDAARKEGRDGMSVLSAMGIPGMVIGEVFAESADREAEGWWQAVERTIDGEIVRKAIGGLS